MDRPPTIRFGEFELDGEGRELRRAGVPVEVHATPLRLLLFLVRRRGRVVGREELLEAVWPDAAVSDAALATALKEARHALGDTGSAQHWIRTLRGRGYQFAGAVDEARPDRAPSRGFVGREGVLGSLGDALDAALAGAGRIVLLAGEAGIGKTRTLDELRRFGEASGARVVAGWCVEGEGAPPYWPWVQVARALLPEREADHQRLLVRLGGSAQELARILPELGEEAAITESGTGGESEHGRFRMCDAIVRLLVLASGARPALVQLDDLHWADASSLRVLEVLVREIPRASLLVAGAFRDPGLGTESPLGSALAGLGRFDACERIRLEGLGAPEIRELVRSIAKIEPSADLGDQLDRRTGGNPFFVAELARQLRAGVSLDVPPAVQDTIGARLLDLPEGTRELLPIAAAIGRDFDLDVLRRAAELSAADAIDVLEPARTASLVGDASGDREGGRFAHDLVREAILGELTPNARIALHARIGEAIENAHAADLTPYLGDLARHFGEAAPGGEHKKAVHYAALAGRQANELLAHDEAVQHFQKALHYLELGDPPDLHRHCEVLVELARAESAAARPADANGTFERARRAADANGLEKLRAQAVLGLAATSWVLHDGSAPRVVALLEEELEALPPGDLAPRVQLLRQLAPFWGMLSDFEPACAAAREALDLSRRVDDPEVRALGLEAAMSVLAEPGDIEVRLALAAELLELAEANGVPRWELAAREARSQGLLQIGDLAGVRAEVEGYRSAAGATRSRWSQARAAALDTSFALLEARFAEADRGIEEIFTLAGELESHNLAVSGVGLRFLLRREQGRLGELEGAFRAASIHVTHIRLRPLCLATIALESGREEEARRQYEIALERDFDRGGDSWLQEVGLSAELACSFGDVERAEDLYARLLPHGRIGITAMPLAYYGSTSRYLALLAETLGRLDDALEHLAEAQGTHERVGARMWIARTRYEEARVRLARGAPGDRERAAKLVEQSAVEAREIGTARLLEQLSALDLP